MHQLTYIPVFPVLLPQVTKRNLLKFKMPENNIIKSPLLELMFKKKKTDEFLLPLVQAETRILPD